VYVCGARSVLRMFHPPPSQGDSAGFFRRGSEVRDGQEWGTGAAWKPQLLLGLPFLWSGETVSASLDQE
jgi:hypothetical protein